MRIGTFITLLLMMLSTPVASADESKGEAKPIPLVDLAHQTWRQVLVDREEGQYLGHPTTVLLKDGQTIITVYPKGHGRGAIIMKRSPDGGLTWSERLPVPENWATSKETPTIHRTIDPRDGTKRLIMFSGLYPIRMAHSEDDGATWTGLEPIGEFGGIVAMNSVTQLKDGSYVAIFHDDGRFFTEENERTETFTLYQTISLDGGLTWSLPDAIWSGSDVHLCEGGVIRSPEGTQLAMLLRENRRAKNSHVMFSDDEAKTWSTPRELPWALTGDRHTGVYGPDGRLFISFRDTASDSPTQGDWLGWVGTYDDIFAGRPGQYRVRLMDNRHRWDCAYPGVLILPDGTIVTTTYGHWAQDKEPYIMTVRFTLEELDRTAAWQQIRVVDDAGTWMLAFEDEFTSSALDETLWTPRDPWERGRNNELQAYVPSAWEVRDGAAHAVARREQAEYAGKKREYTSGMMNTRTKFHQKFGRFEIRCRAPKGKGLWPAFWLLPAEPPGWPPEIDVLEILGDRITTAYFTHHWRDPETSNLAKDGGELQGPDWSAEFHTFRVDWLPDAIVWSVDGEEHFRSTKSVPADRPMFMLVNLAVGGDWPGAPNDQTPFPSSLEVEFVRVYRLLLDDDPLRAGD